jgi:hypothetical protein
MLNKIQHAADSCVHLRPIIDLLVCHSMPLELWCMGVRIDKASTVEIVGEAKTALEVATFVSMARAVYHQTECCSSREFLSLGSIDIGYGSGAETLCLNKFGALKPCLDINMT